MNIYRKKNIIKKCIFEFLGTGLIIFFGISCLAASKLTNVKFNEFEMSCVWGLGVSLSMYLTSHISGAHLNPAITIFLCLSSKFNIRKVLPYIISQILGAFFFTILVYCFYNHLLIEFVKKNNIIIGTIDSVELAYIFCIYPNYNNSFLYNAIVEICANTILIIFLLELNRQKKYFFFQNTFIKPILMGMFICMINFIVNPISNISLNPARDLGPKIFLSIIGWGTLSFTGGNNNILYCLIPTIGPIIGCNLGGWIHKKIHNN